MQFRHARYRVSENNIVTMPGFDWGSTLHELARNGPYALWYQKGHMGWAGRGERAYYSPTYMIVRSKTDESGDTRATLLFGVNPGRKWRQVRECLVEMVERL